MEIVTDEITRKAPTTAYFVKDSIFADGTID